METSMNLNTRRNFFGKIGAMAAIAIGAPAVFSQSLAPASGDHSGKLEAQQHGHIHNSHVHDGIYYFSGTGSNDGYSDHITVTDPFEKHVIRTMDVLKKSLERHGCTMDSILHLEVFLCLPLADGVSAPTGKARFDAYKAQYDGLNKIYRTYFSPGKAPSRACMALDWIPGDSLIEMVGSALIVNSPASTIG